MGNAPDRVQWKQNQVQRKTGMWLSRLGIRLHGFIRMSPTLLFDHYHVATSGEKHLGMVTFSFCSTGAPLSSVLGGSTEHRKRHLRLFSLDTSGFKCKYYCFTTWNSLIFWKNPNLNIMLQALYGAAVVWVRLNKQKNQPSFKRAAAVSRPCVQWVTLSFLYSQMSQLQVKIFLSVPYMKTPWGSMASPCCSLFSTSGEGKYPQCADAPAQAIEREPPLRI